MNSSTSECTLGSSDESGGGSRASSDGSDEEDSSEEGSGSGLQGLGLQTLLLSQTIQNFSSEFNGKLLSTDITNGRGGNDSLKFLCKNGHEFSVTLHRLQILKRISLSDELCQESWCLKCKNFQDKCLKKAEKKNSILVSHKFDTSVYEFKCEKGHQFSIKYARNLPKEWCKACKQDELKILKDIELQKQKAAI